MKKFSTKKVMKSLLREVKKEMDLCYSIPNSQSNRRRHLDRQKLLILYLWVMQLKLLELLTVVLLLALIALVLVSLLIPQLT